MPMIDREKVTTVLLRRFPDASSTDIAAAANAIVGLGHEYEPVNADEIRGFHCVDDRSAYRLNDVLSGRVRVLRRVREPW